MGFLTSYENTYDRFITNLGENLRLAEIDRNTLQKINSLYDLFLYYVNNNDQSNAMTTWINMLDILNVVSTDPDRSLTFTELVNIYVPQQLGPTTSPTFAGLTINGNIGITGTVDGRDVAADGTKLDGVASGAEVNVQSNWTESNSASDAFILNKPTTITQSQADAIIANTAKRTYPSADETKLAGIESGATADQTAAEIKTAYESNADTNEFSDAEQTKLAGIESGATADQTALEIKTAYESNSDTNEFSDAEQTKLSSIDSGAQNNTATNVGSGEGIFRDKTGSTINLRTIVAGTGATITTVGDTIQIDATGAGGGEVNTGNNVGSGGVGIFRDKTGVMLNFKNINSGSNISVTDDTANNEIDIAVSASPSFTGITVTGAASFMNNIIVSGTVDGRDVSVDGAKLDTITSIGSGQIITSSERMNIGNSVLVTGTQSIAGNKTFTGQTQINNNFIVSAASPRVIYQETDQTGSGSAWRSIISDKDYFLQTADDISFSTNRKTFISAHNDAEITLHHNNSEKFRTEANGVGIIGTDTGNSNVSAMGFYDSNDTTVGFVGKASSSDADTYLSSSTGNVHILAASGNNHTFGASSFTTGGSISINNVTAGATGIDMNNTDIVEVNDLTMNGTSSVLNVSGGSISGVSTLNSGARTLNIQSGGTTRFTMDQIGNINMAANVQISDSGNLDMNDGDIRNVNDLSLGGTDPSITGMTSISFPPGGGSISQVSSINGQAYLTRTTVNIGNWDMSSDSFVNIIHGVTVANIRGIRVLIYNDTQTALYPPETFSSATGDPAATAFVNGSAIRIDRVTSGFFDSTDFDSTTINRGYIIIDHT